MNVTDYAKAAPPDEIELRELFIALWNKKLFILLCSFAGLALSGVYAFFFAKPVFVSSALLIPTQNEGPNQFGAAAALLGKKPSSSDDIELYQELLSSRTVLQKVLMANIRNESDSGGGKLEPMFKVLHIDTSKAIAMDGAIAMLKASITAGSKVAENGGILEVRFEGASPWFAQQLGEKVLAIGQEELRLVRIARSNMIIARLAVADSLARLEWDSAAKRLAWYKDRNRSIVLPAQEFQISRLEMEKMTKEQKYLLARKEYEGQVLEREKAAPPMMILDSANRPSTKSKPKRTLLLLLGFISASFVASIGTLARKFLFKEAN